MEMKKEEMEEFIMKMFNSDRKSAKFAVDNFVELEKKAKNVSKETLEEWSNVLKDLKNIQVFYEVFSEKFQKTIDYMIVIMEDKIKENKTRYTEMN
jgi:hypothetical protein